MNPQQQQQISLHTWVPPSPQEQQLYDRLFDQVDDQRRNVIGGPQAVALFSRSHVDKSVLREIWNIADGRRQSALSRQEFYVAMRLISMAQHGEQVSVQRFHGFANRPYPLARIEGVVLPQEVHCTPQNVQQQQLPTQVQVQAHIQVPPRNVGMGGHPQQLLSTGASFVPTAEEMGKYQLVFQQYDTDHDGFLNGAEAVALFQLSGLDRNVLREIWSMADVTRDSKLSVQEFYVAMHLIVCVSKRGLRMPPTLPRELSEAVFSARSVGAGAALDQGSGSQGIASASQNELVGKQQEDAPPYKPEGMCAFDSLSTTEDTPLPNLLPPPSPCDSRKSAFDQADTSGSNVQLEGFSGPPAASPSVSLHGSVPTSFEQQERYGFTTTHTPSVAVRARTNSASSMNSMSSFGDFSSLSSQQSMQLPLHDFGSNDRAQAGNPSYQAQHGLAAGGGFGVPQTLSEKPFMSGEEEKRLARQLDQQNRDFAQIVADVEHKLPAIETMSIALDSLHEMRDELVALVMKRDAMRAASTSASASNGDVGSDKTWHAVAQSLQSLVDNQKQLVRRLQSDISREESELEEAILSAKLQQKMSLESRSPVTGATSPPVSTHASSGAAKGEATAFASTPLTFGEPNGMSLPVTVPSAPPMSTSPHGVADSSGFDAFGSFESGPSPAATIPSTIPPTSPFSQHSSASPSARGDGNFDAFDDCAAVPSTGKDPSLLLDFGGESPFTSASVPAAVSDDTGFGDFNAAAPLATCAESMLPPIPAAIDASFAPFQPSPSPAAIAFSGFDDFGTAPSSTISVAVMEGTSDSTNFSSEPTSFFDADSSASAHEFGPRDLLVATEDPVFDAFPTTALFDADATPSASTAVDTPNLLLASVAADKNEPDAFGDFGGVTASIDTAVEFAESAAFELQPSGSALSPSTSSSIAAMPSSTIGSLPAMMGSAEEAFASEKTTGDSPFSPVASADSNSVTGLGDFDGFGGFIAAPTDTTAPLSTSTSIAATPSSNSCTIDSFPATMESVEEAFASEKTTSDSPFSPVASADSNSVTGLGDFDGFGGFIAAPTLTDTTAPLSAPDEPAAMISDTALYSPEAKIDNEEGCEDISVASASTLAATTGSQTTESVVGNECSPVPSGSKKLGDFVDINLASVTADSDNTLLSPVNDGFEVIDDFVAAPLPATGEKAVDTSNCSDSEA